MKGKVVKHHWLYGELRFQVEVEKEDSCAECIHWPVCKRDMEHYCKNFDFGTSEYQSCESCLHRFTRFDEEKEGRIPCFRCSFFEVKKDGKGK